MARMPVSIAPHDFDEIVSQALDLVPPSLSAQLDNVVILTEDEPSRDQRDIFREAPCEAGGGELLGLYEGTPLTDRGEWWSAGALPDRITIFRGPLGRCCTDEADLRRQVAVTVVHEIAHHFGIDDERLDELGWG